jgi:CubicO group peptidase (beta-lactamase class C family)
MRSGLAVGQSLAPRWDAPFDPANQIMFAAPDMAAAAASRRLKAKPGTAWSYSDGNTAILGRLIRERVGGAAETQAFARRELFDPLGMRAVTLETDATGSPIGATQVYASARDWARLGQLFLDDGMVGDRRVLPPGWVAYSTRLTPGSEAFGYGAGFWVSAARPANRPAMPAGSFMARGARGQYVVVVPSARLVVVKLGDADGARGDFEQMVSVVDAAVSWATAGAGSARELNPP